MRRASLITVSVALVVVLTTGVALAATIKGTDGPDFLRGTNSADNIGARGGNDEVRARAGNDKVYGGTQRDKLYGMENGDLVVGGDGNDELDGGIGNDTLKSFNDGNADNLTCNQGTDTAFVEPNDTVDDNRTGDLALTAANNLSAPVTSCETIRVYVTNDLVVTLKSGEVAGVAGGTRQDAIAELVDQGFVTID